MIAHTRIPQFYARAMGSETDSGDKHPTVVVDEGRIIDCSPQALERGVTPGTLLETTELPDDIRTLTFNLDVLNQYQTQFYQWTKDEFPIIENFRFGELFFETDHPDKFRDWMTSHSTEFEFPVSGALTDSGWLSRILSNRK
ncbi:MAG: hypothetical protein ABEK50_07310, partial [bacterium]